MTTTKHACVSAIITAVLVAATTPAQLPRLRYGREIIGCRNEPPRSLPSSAVALEIYLEDRHVGDYRKLLISPKISDLSLEGPANRVSELLLQVTDHKELEHLTLRDLNDPDMVASTLLKSKLRPRETALFGSSGTADLLLKSLIGLEPTRKIFVADAAVGGQALAETLGKQTLETMVLGRGARISVNPDVTFQALKPKELGVHVGKGSKEFFQRVMETGGLHRVKRLALWGLVDSVTIVQAVNAAKSLTHLDIEPKEISQDLLICLSNRQLMVLLVRRFNLLDEEEQKKIVNFARLNPRKTVIVETGATPFQSVNRDRGYHGWPEWKLSNLNTTGKPDFRALKFDEE